MILSTLSTGFETVTFDLAAAGCIIFGERANFKNILMRIVLS
jgi:hypothetical protein